jgi:hypothetical protein
MEQLNINSEISLEKSQQIILDLLIDVLATNKDLLDKLESIYPANSFYLNNSQSRHFVIEHLKNKHLI